MQKNTDFRGLRDRGYEALLLLGGFMALALRPTVRHAIELESRIGEVLLRRKEFALLERRGLVEAEGGGAEGIVRLTRLGQEMLSGGRDPEMAWERSWDGQWRLLVFDLPREERATRAKFWRWLRTHHFGQFQGSVWVTPDPVPALADAAREAGLKESMFTVFTGQIEGKSRRGKDVAADIWDFEKINAAYAEYVDFVERSLNLLRQAVPSAGVTKTMLREDRKRWWDAVRGDPLLPGELIPAGYRGKTAWKLRQELHAALIGVVDLDAMR